MTNQKLYALKTSDTGEWVNVDPYTGDFYVTDALFIFPPRMAVARN